nr:hypothetical protein JVH1_1105 [Rhodococcus sp. JVH1]
MRCYEELSYLGEMSGLVVDEPKVHGGWSIGLETGQGGSHGFGTLVDVDLTTITARIAESAQDWFMGCEQGFRGISPDRPPMGAALSVVAPPREHTWLSGGTHLVDRRVLNRGFGVLGASVSSDTNTGIAGLWLLLIASVVCRSRRAAPQVAARRCRRAVRMNNLSQPRRG